MDDLKKQVESILFSVGRKIELPEIAKLVKERNVERVQHALEELRGDYEARNSSLMLVQDGTAWKLTVREQFIPTVRKIVTQTELPKSVMETLAIIAYKAPVLQSEIVKIRTNKAYDHLVLLEQDGFISRKKQGRTKLIQLSQKFFQYFDIPEDQLRQKFSSVKALENAIGEKEGEIETRQQEILEHQAVVKRQEDEHKKHVEREHRRLDEEIARLPEIDLLDEEGKKHKLEAYPTTPIPPEPTLGPQIEVVKADGFETYGEEAPEAPASLVAEPAAGIPALTETPAQPPKAPSLAELAEVKVLPEGADEDEELAAARKEAAEELAAEHEELPPSEEEKIEQMAERIAKGEVSREFSGKGVFSGGVTPEIARRIDERVEELVHGTKEHHHDEEGLPHTEESEEPAEDDTGGEADAGEQDTADETGGETESK